MSNDYEQDDVSAFFDHGADSATFDQATDSVGLPDDPSVDQPLPDRIADQVEEWDRHQDDKDQELGEFVEEEVDEQQHPKGKVPLGALQEERTKRQQAQDHARALEQQLAAQQQQMQQWQAQMQAAQQAQQQQLQQEAIPDFDEDPRGYIEAKERQFQQALQNMQQTREYEQAAAQVASRAQELGQFGVQAAAEFEAEHPEYREAFDMVHNNAAAALRQMHPGATEQQILVTQAAAMFEFLDGCQRNGLNPAESIFKKAQEQGFTPGQRVPSTRLPRTPPTSLSTLAASGRAPDQQGSYKAKDIANLSNEEFNRLFESMRDTQNPAV